MKSHPLFTFTISRDSVLQSIYRVNSPKNKMLKKEEFKLYEKPSVVFIHQFQRLCSTLFLFHRVPSSKKFNVVQGGRVLNSTISHSCSHSPFPDTLFYLPSFPSSPFTKKYNVVKGRVLKIYDKPSVVLIHHFLGLCFTFHLFHQILNTKECFKIKSFKLYD
jgi:hypothetical protein